jgi:hypothetical protein
MQDSIFVVTLLTSPGQVTVVSGNNTETFNAPAGASAWEVGMGVGQQKFSLTRDSKTVLEGTSLKDVTDVCICGIYNFNAYVGSLPSLDIKPLAQQGLASLTAGLHVTTCSAAPSLGNGTADVVQETTAAGGAPTSSAGPISSAGAVSSAGHVSSALYPTMTTTQIFLKPSSGTGPVSSQPTQTNKPTSAIVNVTGPTTPPSPKTMTQSSPPPSSTGGTCNGGTVLASQSGNYKGLCEFSCAMGYCPPAQCQCTSYGTPMVAAGGQPNGCPLNGEDDSYKGLCSFACSHGYCPPTACRPC